MEIEGIVKDRADWLVDAVAMSTQDRRFLRGDPDEDKVATEALELNAKKAIEVAITRALENRYQQRVNYWMLKCFGLEVAADTTERNYRFAEEALELVQSLGCSAEEAHKLVDYVFGRPGGVTEQEVGGVMVTLAALCNAQGISINEQAERELARVSEPATMEKIRKKHKAKIEQGMSTSLPGIIKED